MMHSDDSVNPGVSSVDESQFYWNLSHEDPVKAAMLYSGFAFFVLLVIIAAFAWRRLHEPAKEPILEDPEANRKAVNIIQC